MANAKPKTTTPSAQGDLVAIRLTALGEADEYLKKLTGKPRIRKGEVVKMPADKAAYYLESGRWETAKATRKTKAAQPRPEDAGEPEGAEGSADGSEGDGKGGDK